MVASAGDVPKDLTRTVQRVGFDALRNAHHGYVASKRASQGRPDRPNELGRDRVHGECR